MSEDKTRLIIVSNRAPIADYYKGTGLTVGGLATALHRVAIDQSATWIFSADIAEERLVGYKSPENLNYTLCPVPINKKEFKAFYDGYSNSLLWPLFHYFPDKASFDGEDWLGYQTVNKKFAIQVLEVIENNPSAVIWIQDYQLMLVAKYLRQFGVKNKIGFFLHIPFPTYEVFRLLPQRQEILEGLLSFDLLGFHTKSYVTNFFRSVKTIIQETVTFEAEKFVRYKDKACFVKNFPISVDSTMIIDLIRNKKFGVTDIPSIGKALGSATMIGLGVDRLDYTKGILERFRALEYFFKKNTKYRGKLTFVQIAVPSRGSVPDYQSYKSAVDEIVTRINGQYGTMDWQPIIYLNRSIPFENLVNYYQMADFALITPIRDGMNLVAKEFILTCKQEASLILSEVAGAAEEFPEASLVNPYNQEQISNAILHSLENPGFQQEIINRYRNFLLEHDVHLWAKSFIEEMRLLGEESPTLSIDSNLFN
jgi:trehalose 6-phosphate synthase/phosphatase